MMVFLGVLLTVVGLALAWANWVAGNLLLAALALFVAGVNAALAYVNWVPRT